MYLVFESICMMYNILVVFIYGSMYVVWGVDFFIFFLNMFYKFIYRMLNLEGVFFFFIFFGYVWKKYFYRKFNKKKDLCIVYFFISFYNG